MSSALIRTPIPAQAPITPTQIKTITDYINQYRAIHQAPPLAYDDTIAQVSQTWANYLLGNNLFQHSGNVLYGENLTYFQGYGNDVDSLLKQSVDLWYNEVKLYDFSNPGFSESTGHFSLLVWKSSKTFGIGFSINPSNNNTVEIVMNTSSAGNVIGQFAANVLPAISSIPTPVLVTPVVTPVVIPTPVVVPIPPAIVVKPITDNNHVHNMMALYKILNDVLTNRSRYIIATQLKQLIRDMSDQV